ncbi:MAG: ribose-phosphate diphosphokinase [Actinomycetota bacterium]
MSGLEIVTKKHLMLFSGRANRLLGEEIADEMATCLGEVDISDFANGEIYVRFRESVRGSDAFVIQSHCHPVNVQIMEQLIMIDALKRASAKRISVVVPFFGYARQDKKTLAREPIAAKLMADLFQTAGANRLITMDLHTPQIQGFFNGPVDHLSAVPLIASYMKENLAGESELVVVSPDAGRVRTAEKYAAYLGCSLAIMHKRRTAHNVAQILEVVGEVEDRICVIVDDMIDTGGTVVKAAEVLVAQGAAGVVVAATHPVLSDPAIDRLKNSPIRQVVVTNTLPVPQEKRIEKMVVLSIAGLIAKAINAVFEDESVSEMFRIGE